MAKYIHLHKKWPAFAWDNNQLISPLSLVRHKQGKLIGELKGLGFQLREEATLETLTQDVIKSSEIEGEKLPADQVRSSIAKRLGIAIAGEVAVNRHVDGIVEMMLDATQNYEQKLTKKKLFTWHASLFPTAHSGMQKIRVGNWRDDSTGPMQVVSGPLGKEKIHFVAPDASRLNGEMQDFLKWFNEDHNTDPVLKAAIAQFWFVTIHPFDDGNGRIARAITDMQLARADETKQRFYSMSSQIQKERNAYYRILEITQRGDLDITNWLLWFLQCLNRSIILSQEILSEVIYKAKFWEKHQSTVLNTRQRKMLNRLTDRFEGKLTSSKWAKITKCSADTALRDIQDLVEKKILLKEYKGGRSTSYKMV